MMSDDDWRFKALYSLFYDIGFICRERAMRESVLPQRRDDSQGDVSPRP